MRRILLICAAMAAVWFFANLPDLYARVKLDRSFPALSRYEFEPTPDIVLVGSSMTFRLYEGYFQTPVRNLAISGGSPLTGLAIIASYQSVPRMVLVETNILTRPTDKDLVSQFGKNDAEPFKWFRPARALISAVYYRIKFRATEPAPESVETDIEGPVSDTLQEYESTRFDNDVTRNAEDLKQLANSLEARGCKVVFFELPYPPPIGASRLARKVRDLIPARRIDGSQLNFVDAYHMDERSAAKVAREIELQFRVR